MLTHKYFLLILFLLFFANFTKSQHNLWEADSILVNTFLEGRLMNFEDLNIVPNWVYRHLGIRKRKTDEFKIMNDSLNDRGRLNCGLLHRIFWGGWNTQNGRDGFFIYSLPGEDSMVCFYFSKSRKIILISLDSFVFEFLPLKKAQLLITQSRGRIVYVLVKGRVLY